MDLNIDPFSEELVQRHGEEENVQALWGKLPKPPPEERQKLPPLEEKSKPKQCSPRRRLIIVEDDKILDINIDPFAEQWIQSFEEQDENKALEGQTKDKGLNGNEAKEETDDSSQENCF